MNRAARREEDVLRKRIQKQLMKQQWFNNLNKGTSVTRDEIVTAFVELKTLLKGMKVPEHRKDNPHWLEKNLGTFNKDNPNYKSAMEVVEKLLAAGARSLPK